MVGVPSGDGGFKASPKKWLPSISKVGLRGQPGGNSLECELRVLDRDASSGSPAGARLVTSGLTPEAEEVVGRPPAISSGWYKGEAAAEPSSL